MPATAELFVDPSSVIENRAGESEMAGSLTKIGQSAYGSALLPIAELVMRVAAVAGVLTAISCVEDTPRDVRVLDPATSEDWSCIASPESVELIVDASP